MLQAWDRIEWETWPHDSKISPLESRTLVVQNKAKMYCIGRIFPDRGAKQSEGLLLEWQKVQQAHKTGDSGVSLNEGTVTKSGTLQE